MAHVSLACDGKVRDDAAGGVVVDGSGAGATVTSAEREGEHEMADGTRLAPKTKRAVWASALRRVSKSMIAD